VKGEQKTQSTRLLLAKCEVCGYPVRLTKKWAAVGLPRCTCGGAFALT